MIIKEQAIKEYLALPIKVGDQINVKGMSSRNPENLSLEKVEKIDDKYVYFKVYGWNELQKRLISEVTKYTGEIGLNPFQREIRTTSYSIDIEQMLWRCGYDRRDKEERTEKHFGVLIPEVCFNPTVIDKEGNEVEYQRGLVWSLEQKQLLIESIYNHVEIGKVVVRKRSFGWVENRVKKGKIEHTAFFDVVDGKQRYHAIIGFIHNEFPDFAGNYFTNFSDKAKREFFNYRHLSFVELPEEANDADTLAVFLAINFSGVPMSKEHLDYVKSIKTK